MNVIDDRYVSVEASRHVEYKGCDMCNDPAVWEAEFGAPFPYVGNKRKTMLALCPVCGRQLRGSKED